MRHGKKVNHLSRKKGHRRALLANLAISLIQHKRITTTLAKAKALRIYVEPLISKAKSATTHDHRVVFSYLQNKEAIKELFEVVGPKVGARPGGYTRIIKLVNRRSDNAEVAIIELVDFNETMVSASGVSSTAAAETSKKTRRSKGKKSTTTENVAAPKNDEVANQEDAQTQDDNNQEA